MTKERNLEIMKRREQGETLASIAKDFGISGSRVRQIAIVTRRNLGIGTVEKPLLCKREEDTFVFRCPWCGRLHIHGAKEGWRSSHCHHRKAPQEYYIAERVKR